MSHFLGIDLGSTTSKAVLIDGGGRVVGQGLTNTRSNYDVAAQVAKAEALADAHLSRLEAALVEGGVTGAGALATALRRAARVLASTERLAALTARCAALAKDTPAGGAQAEAGVRKLFGLIAQDADALFGPLATDRSRADNRRTPSPSRRARAPWRRGTTDSALRRRSPASSGRSTRTPARHRCP